MEDSEMAFNGTVDKEKAKLVFKAVYNTTDAKKVLNQLNYVRPEIKNSFLGHR
jgi:hypothetical protein